MILIISTEIDVSTHQVIKYLHSNNKKFIRLTEQQFVKSLIIDFSNHKTIIKLYIGDQLINMDDISAFWYRKDDVKFFTQLSIFDANTDINFPKKTLNNFISTEINSIGEFIKFELNKKNHIGNWYIGEGNKLVSFSIAKDVGFIIPRTIVSTELDYIIQNNNDSMIFKPIEDAYVSFSSDELITTNYDNIPNYKFKKYKDKTMYPNCLQEYINKEIEIRVFYLDNICYSMAIFSQSDEKTKKDFRNYNDSRPNKMVPYILPQNITDMINSFMKKMNLRCGSIDLILTKKNEYVFIEVNPFGQYGFVSNECNYDIDSLIACKLITNEKK